MNIVPVLVRAFQNAKLPTLNMYGAVILLLSMSMPWLTASIFGESFNASFFQSADITDIVALIFIIVAFIFADSLRVMSLENKVEKMSYLRGLMILTVSYAIALVVGLFHFLTTDRDGASAGYGFFVYIILTGTLIGANIVRLYKDKEEAGAILQSVRSTAERRLEQVGTTVENVGNDQITKVENKTESSEQNSEELKEKQ